MGRYDLTEQKKPVGLIITVLLILLAAIVFGWLYLNRPQESAVSVVQELTVPMPEALEAEDDSTDITMTEMLTDNAGQLIETEKNVVVQQRDLPPLSESDDLFRQEVGRLSPNFSEFLTGQQLINKNLQIVNDFSQGQRISKHMRFLRLQKPFVVEKDEQGLFISQHSYQRYDQLAQAFASIDVDSAIGIYQHLRPLMLQVFAGFAYPEQYQLEDIFQKAAAEILAAPVIDSRIAVVRPTVRYKFADKKLEALSPVQKQMLRMGPDNTRMIQKKLRALVQQLVQINKE